MKKGHTVLVEDQVWSDGKNAGINMSQFLEDSLSKILYSEGGNLVSDRDLTAISNIIKNSFPHFIENYKKTHDRSKLVVLKRLLARQFEVHATITDLTTILEGI